MLQDQLQDLARDRRRHYNFTHVDGADAVNRALQTFDELYAACPTCVADVRGGLDARRFGRSRASAIHMLESILKSYARRIKGNNDVTLSLYEVQRQQNMAQNAAFLDSLNMQ